MTQPWSSAVEEFDVTEVRTQIQMLTLLPDYQGSSQPENPSPAGTSATCRQTEVRETKMIGMEKCKRGIRRKVRVRLGRQSPETVFQLPFGPSTCIDKSERENI
jgi:hypothetical protein